MKFRSLLAAVALLALPGFAQAGGLHVATKTLTAKNGNYDISVAYPQTGVKAIDDDLAAYARDAVAQFRKDSTDDHQVGERPYDLETTFSVARNDGQVFAVLFDIYEDTGGAHPNHDFYTANYLMPDGWRVYLPELLDGSRGLKRIGDLAQADLIRRITKGDEAMSDPDTIKSGTTQDWDNYRNFLLMPKTVDLHFPPYQVASYASGPQESHIPLASLADVMRPNPRKPAASFDCAMARTSLEQLLCSDVALARLDRDVAEAYATHLRDGNTPATQAGLRTNQRAWLASRDKTCAPAGARAACLTDFYKTRLAWLSHQP
jgi:peptidoglycan-N-acetylglucosamine deacetylase